MNEIKEYTEKIFEDIKHIDENVEANIEPMQKGSNSL